MSLKLPEFLAIKPWCLITSHKVACVGPSSFMGMNEEREDMADGGDRARTSQLAAGGPQEALQRPKTSVCQNN